MDPPISNYRPADHLSEQYLLLLKMLIAFQIRLLVLLVLCNANEEIGFYTRLCTESKMAEAVRVSCWNILSSRCIAAPWGVCLSLFVFVRGFFEANTHFITLTLIKNTWPYSRGQSVHKSAQCSVQHSPSKALRPLLLRS